MLNDMKKWRVEWEAHDGPRTHHEAVDLNAEVDYESEED